MSDIIETDCEPNDFEIPRNKMSTTPKHTAAAPIVVCENGHQWRQKCIDQASYCPICGHTKSHERPEPTGELPCDPALLAALETGLDIPSEVLPPWRPKPARLVALLWVLEDHLKMLGLHSNESLGTTTRLLREVSAEIERLENALAASRRPKPHAP